MPLASETLQNGQKEPKTRVLESKNPSCFATVDQLVEQRFRKPQVVGSSPTRGSSFGLVGRLPGNYRPRPFFPTYYRLE